MNFFRSLYLQPRFYYAGVGLVVLFGISYFVPPLFGIAQLGIGILVLLLLLDMLFLYMGRKKIRASRILPEKFSNGDRNTVSVEITNLYPFKTFIEIIDEIPEQFQVRDFSLKLSLNAKESKTIKYQLTPFKRGVYAFGDLNLYTSSILGMISKRYRFDSDQNVKTYPSFKQLKDFELLNFNRNSIQMGVKKIRRIGHSMEFEQIKDYVQGDDLRTINWKATAKKNDLMVNLYQDEKSQPVYSIIDKGRAMQMPFNGLSLLDYAINATLVISNVVLKNHDKAGMMAFSKKVENVIVAEKRSSQMPLILESLYNIKTNFFESDYSKLYATVKQNITHRSLILLYSNFETLDSLHRQLPYLKAIAKNHLLVVVFFKNTEVSKIMEQKAETIQEIYDKVIAEKFAFEKRLIVNELKKYGIYSILTAPENLTVNTINKYLEIKARGLL